MLAMMLLPALIYGKTIDVLKIKDGKISITTFSSQDDDPSTTKSPIERVFDDLKLSKSDPAKITSLVLSHRNLERVPLNIAEVFPNLRDLDLSCNQISSLDGLSSLKNLKLLDLGFNQLNGKDLGGKFKSGLQELYLNDNPLQNISSNAFEELKSLKKLNLSNTKINCLPNSFRNLNRLAHLNLDCNNITELPGYMFTASPCLKSMCLARNKLTFIPPEISKLKDLTVLELKGNNLEYLPKSIKELNLTHIDLADNPNFKHSSPFPEEMGQQELKDKFRWNVHFSNEDNSYALIHGKSTKHAPSVGENSQQLSGFGNPLQQVPVFADVRQQALYLTNLQMLLSSANPQHAPGFANPQQPSGFRNPQQPSGFTNLQSFANPDQQALYLRDPREHALYIAGLGNPQQSSGFGKSTYQQAPGFGKSSYQQAPKKSTTIKNKGPFKQNLN